MTSKQIRQAFISFFESKKHHIVPSAPMVIKDDPTLMFTNAGMNQFKNIILGNDPIIHSRVADSQKCLRVSGKHNDLEEVGHDTYHHTMFEMLGNWSFGDYFKKEAIEYAWEFLAEVLHLDKNRLYVTVFEGSPDENLDRDDEAAEYWAKYLPLDRIINGNRHDNFWEMGDTGPCGPCSEIHIDLRPDSERQAVNALTLVNQSHPQVIEIWNLVFMQYNRKADGSLEPLPNRVIDTGMGFERLCMAIQGKTSNYDTDVFTPIIKEIEKITGSRYSNSSEDKIPVAMRVIADHVRTVAFSIADGQLPSNVKSGYVIRRILRRAVRYGYTFLGQKAAFIYKLLPVLVETMGDAFPELRAQQTLTGKVIKEEEESFLRTLETGIRILNKYLSENENQKILDGKVAFELYDACGFPLDLTELILREKGKTVDIKEFNACMQKQKDRARNATAVETGDWVIVREGEPEFVGYDQSETETQILRYRKMKQKDEEYYQIVLSKTPFYGEMGGQVGDRGVLTEKNMQE
jgi:alanyl-tRNA synthetase